ncbi:hypothetical protein ACROAE_10440 [Shewanella sp. MF05960]|uniref:hypothetical protein n=1 Tax=Shewanella sp. MF05960 TaxID=3434874 RepID=UPI003D78F441
MIARSYIESNLKQLDKLYLNAITLKSKLYYSKLAMLELCGWIEESMDDIVQKCANRSLKSQANKNYIATQIIKPTYGFEYKKHFMKMLTYVVGLINIEKLEDKLDPLKKARLESALGTLKSARNREAHTHLKGVTRQVDAPSITINLFNHVFDGLKDIELHLKELSY